MEENIYVPSTVFLDVGGFFYTTSRTTLVSEPDTMLAVMFSGRHELKTENGRYFIDRNGEFFSHILDWLRDKTLYPDLPYDKLLRIRIEAKFFNIQSLVDTIDTELTRSRYLLYISENWHKEEKNEKTLQGFLEQGYQLEIMNRNCILAKKPLRMPQQPQAKKD